MSYDGGQRSRIGERNRASPVARSERTVLAYETIGTLDAFSNSRTLPGQS